MVVSTCSNQRHKPSPGQVVIRDDFSRYIHNTLDGINLGLNGDGITYELSPKLPLYIYNGLSPVISEVLKPHGMDKTDVHIWAIYPGGPKIIDESVRSLNLGNEVATHSWDVLARFENMLSASLPFVLACTVEKTKSERISSKGIAFSFGPGITVEGILSIMSVDEGGGIRPCAYVGVQIEVPPSLELPDCTQV